MSLDVLQRRDVVSVSGAITGACIVGDRGIGELPAIQLQLPTPVRPLVMPSADEQPHADLSALYGRLLARNAGRPRTPRSGHPLSGELNPL